MAPTTCFLPDWESFLFRIPCDCVVYSPKGDIIAISDNLQLKYSQDERGMRHITHKALSIKEGETLQYTASLSNVDYEVTAKNTDNQILVLVKNMTEFMSNMIDKANRDPMTGLFNRRGFAEEVEKKIMSSSPDAVFHVIGVDIDDFKTINDASGHAAGDEVIKAVAKCCAEGVRSTDIAGRWGGEEFFMFIEAHPEKAFEIAERLRENIFGKEFVFDNMTTWCTASIGISDASKSPIDIEEMFKKADMALYQAKNSGKNKTVYYKKDD